MAEYALDPRDTTALRCALDLVLPEATSLTVHMCWHAGVGHDYPADVLEAAGRLRERHPRATEPGWEDYTSLSFVPSLEDRDDFLTVAPVCDLAYATDGSDRLLGSVSGEGTEAQVALTETQHALLLAKCPGTRLTPIRNGASVTRGVVARLRERLRGSR